MFSSQEQNEAGMSKVRRANMGVLQIPPGLQALVINQLYVTSSTVLTVIGYIISRCISMTTTRSPNQIFTVIFIKMYLHLFLFYVKQRKIAPFPRNALNSLFAFRIRADWLALTPHQIWSTLQKVWKKQEKEITF